MLDFDDGTFQLPLRVYIEDTDAGGIVFYANYLKYFERARTEFFRQRGFELRQGLSENVNYVVHSLSVNYRKPARLDDLLVVTASVIELGRTYLLFSQTVLDEMSNTLVEAQIKIACLHFESATPRRLPETLVRSLQS
ncbi:MAG: tol-pal system-associated acyl-CoA thioesterase [Oleiphilus sp.]